MPEITRIAHVELTVRNLDISEAWYIRVLGFKRVFVRGTDDTGRRAVALLHEGSRTVLALVEHVEGVISAFDYRQPGLDHLAFAVADRAALAEWERHLEEAGVVTSGVQERDATVGRAAGLTFQDPDGIALELFVGGAP